MASSSVLNVRVGQQAGKPSAINQTQFDPMSIPRKPKQLRCHEPDSSGASMQGNKLPKSQQSCGQSEAGLHQSCDACQHTAFRVRPKFKAGLLAFRVAMIVCKPRRDHKLPLFMETNAQSCRMLDYVVVLEDLGKYLAMVMPEELKGEAIPPLNQEPTKPLMSGEFATKKKTVKQEVLSLGFKLSLCSILVAIMVVGVCRGAGWQAWQFLVVGHLAGLPRVQDAAPKQAGAPDYLDCFQHCVSGGIALFRLTGRWDLRQGLAFRQMQDKELEIELAGSKLQKMWSSIRKRWSDCPLESSSPEIQALKNKMVGAEAKDAEPEAAEDSCEQSPCRSDDLDSSSYEDESPRSKGVDEAMLERSRNLSRYFKGTGNMNRGKSQMDLELEGVSSDDGSGSSGDEIPPELVAYDSEETLDRDTGLPRSLAEELEDSALQFRSIVSIMLGVFCESVFRGLFQQRQVQSLTGRKPRSGEEGNLDEAWPKPFPFKRSSI